MGFHTKMINSLLDYNVSIVALVTSHKIWKSNGTRFNQNSSKKSRPQGW